ncbi:hypothetical protein ACFW9O_36480 [Streptomyces sp. NPDC059499]|uniref:hypothetical protein n=1 Tax=Streptomyces sp. NPDC059499 TaxID=3346852 RepID=UPI0036A1B65D
MSSGSVRSCPALGGACKTDHAKCSGSAHTAFEFAVTVEGQNGARLEAELVEMDPEEGYPRKFAIWAQLCGEFMELEAAADVRRMQEGIYAFLQGLAPLAERLDEEQGDGGQVRAEQEGEFFGPEYTLGVPGEPEVLLAQLFRSETGHAPAVASFHGPGLAADLDAGQTRAFAMRLRRMADDVDRLAVRLDLFPAEQRPETRAVLGKAVV